MVRSRNENSDTASNAEKRNGASAARRNVAQRQTNDSDKESRLHPESGSNTDRHPLLRLQRQQGNQAVQRAVKERIQPKLEVGSPDDRYEREADRIARAVTANSDRNQVSPPSESTGQVHIQQMCIRCQGRLRQRKPLNCPDCEQSLQRKEASSRSRTVGSEVEQQIQSSRGRGRRLPDTVRATFEPRFGQDFGDVRIHDGQRAAELNRTLNARAFTHGQDIYFGAGNYDSDSIAGERLLAHELTHTVQQRGRTKRVQRQPADTPVITFPAASQETQSAGSLDLGTQPNIEEQAQATEGQPSLPLDVARRIGYTVTVLQRVEPLAPHERSRLDEMISGSQIYQLLQRRDIIYKEIHQLQLEIESRERGIETETQRLEDFRRYGTLPGGVPYTEEMFQGLRDEKIRLEAEKRQKISELESLEQEISSRLRELGISESELVEQVEAFPELWEERAKQIAYAMLDENERTVRKERERYSQSVCSPDIEGLREADRQLKNQAEAVNRITGRIEELPREIEQKRKELQSKRGIAEDFRRYGSLPGGVPPSQTELQEAEGEIEQLESELQSLPAELESERQTYQRLHSEYSNPYPILQHPSYNPGALYALPQEELAQVTGEWLDEILQNIEDTRESIKNEDVRVWDLADVGALAFQNLGVPPNSVLGDAVRNYIGDKESDERLLEIAIGALSIVSGLVLGFATGGLAWVAGGVALISGGVSLYRTSREYQAESSAEFVALDPVIADISRNEPELLWLVLDVVGLVFDAGDIIKLLRPAARAVMATGDVGAFAAEAQKVAPSIADQLTETASRQARLNRVAGATADVASDADILARTAEKTILTPSEIDAELRIVSDLEPTVLPRGSDYLLEVRLPPPNNHTWRLSADGRWCRFSNGEFCVIPALVPRELRLLPVEAAAVTVRRVQETLDALATDFPILQDLPLDASAIKRVLEKKTVDRMKGQLLEEFMAVRVRESLQSRAGREALGLNPKEGEPIFIEGHRITDPKSRELTDGIIAVPKNGQLIVRVVFEAKSGSRSAEGLARNYQMVKQMSKGDKIELLSYIKDLYPNTLETYIRTNYPSEYALYRARRFEKLSEGLFLDVLDVRNRQFRRGPAGRILTSELGGQVQRDIERLHGAKIKIDPSGEPLPLVFPETIDVTAGPTSTRFVSALPRDVDSSYVEQTLKDLGYTVDISRFPVDQAELIRLVEELAARLGSEAQ